MTTAASPGPRAALDPALLEQARRRAGCGWPPPVLLGQTGSTNADLADRARAGAPEGTVLVAEHQTAGRGRLDRRWQAPAGSGLLFSVLLRPSGVAAPAWGWLPLLAGVAVAAALGGATGVPVRLKWPNDVVVDGPDRAGGPGPRKLGGILAERADGPAGPAVVVGVGLDVAQEAADLPVPTATSLWLEDPASAAVTREELLAASLAGLERRYAAWRAAGGDAARSGLAMAYRQVCGTLGRQVRVIRPGTEDLVGLAEDVDPAGRLVVVPAGAGPVLVAAGDVAHLR